MSSIRKRLTYANVAMTLALVFAMSGGAYAASKILITSTNQIKPSVLKKLQGKGGANGAAGPAGAPGSAGPQGPQGPQGSAGTPGKDGTNGKDGINGKGGLNGKEGPEGPQGQPWTAGGKLPSASTETGTWSSFATVTVAKNGTLGEAEQETRGVPISFTLPAEPAVTPVYLPVGASATSECPGTPEKPEAKAGFLCVYTTRDLGIGLPSLLFLAPGSTEEELGASPSGTLLLFKVRAETGASSGGWGTWAVTAK